jgi:hypothetical protein
MIQKKVVELTLKAREQTGNEVAYEILARANPHASDLVQSKLDALDITVPNMSKFFCEVAKAVAEFWWADEDPTVKTTLKPHELRMLYLPLIMGVIFGSIGNVDHGNYRYVLKPATDEKVDKDFLFDFSAKLESLRVYIKGDRGQIGNRRAIPQASTMLSTVSMIDGYKAHIEIRDGVGYDEALAGLAALAGLTLVNEAYRILYTGVQEVNFRELLGTIREKSMRLQDDNLDLQS